MDAFAVLPRLIVILVIEDIGVTQNFNTQKTARFLTTLIRHVRGQVTFSWNKKSRWNPGCQDGLIGMLDVLLEQKDRFDYVLVEAPLSALMLFASRFVRKSGDWNCGSRSRL